MFIKSIELENFNNFEGYHRFDFDDLNLIKGKNGSGKSTLGLDAVLFVLYGYTDKTLSDLPTRWVKTKTCSVKVRLEYRGIDWVIERKVPTKIEIYRDGVLDIHETNADKQKILNEIFKNVDYFRKFRMLDVKQGINILEQGKVALKKSLVSFNEGLFNDVRKRLQDKKHEREIYNRDTAFISPHYPSEKRYDVICEGLSKLLDNIDEVKKEFSVLQTETNKDYASSIKHKTLIAENNTKIIRLKNLNSCPTCYQEVPKEHKERILKEFQKVVDKSIECFKEADTTFKDKKEQQELYETKLETLRQQQMSLGALKMKIETRLKQKEYKYSNRDVLIVNQSIKELDRFIANYITDWIKGLEPVINSITSKADLEVYFDLNEKGDFDFNIKRDNCDYSYKDLSDGQRLMLTIAFQGALLIQEGEEGLIVADEGFSSLDEDNLRHIIDLFTELPFQLIFILHRAPELPDNVKIIDLGD